MEPMSLEEWEDRVRRFARKYLGDNLHFLTMTQLDKEVESFVRVTEAFALLYPRDGMAWEHAADENEAFKHLLLERRYGG